MELIDPMIGSKNMDRKCLGCGKQAVADYRTDAFVKERSEYCLACKKRREQVYDDYVDPARQFRGLRDY